MHLFSVPWAVLANVLSMMRSCCEVGLSWNTEHVRTISFEIIVLLETWQWLTQVTPIVTLFSQLFCCSTHEELVGHVLLMKFANFAIMLCDYTRSCRLWQCMLCAVNMYIVLLLSMHHTFLPCTITLSWWTSASVTVQSTTERWYTLHFLGWEGGVGWGLIWCGVYLVDCLNWSNRSSKHLAKVSFTSISKKTDMWQWNYMC